MWWRRRIRGWALWQIGISAGVALLGLGLTWFMAWAIGALMADTFRQGTMADRRWLGYGVWLVNVLGWAGGPAIMNYLWFRRLAGRSAVLLACAAGALKIAEVLTNYFGAVERRATVGYELARIGMPVDGAARIILLGGAAFAGLILLVTASRAINRRRTPIWAPAELEISDSMEAGSARWMDTRLARRRFGAGPLIIGEAYRADLEAPKVPFDIAQSRTWGPGGSAPLLRFNMQVKGGHGLVFAGSGLFKTTANVITPLLGWDGPVVVYDPAGEAWAITRHWRRDKFKRAALQLNHQVLDADGQVAVSFDILAWVDPASPGFADAINDIGVWLLGGAATGKGNRGGNEFFDLSAENLVATILSAAFKPGAMRSLAIGGGIWGQADDHPPFGGLNQTGKKFRPKIDFVSKVLGLKDGELRGFLEDAADNSDATMAHNYGRRYATMHPREFTSVCATAMAKLRWLSDPYKRDMVCGDGDLMGDFAAGTIDLFVTIPSEVIAENEGYARALFGCCVRAVMARRGKIDRRILFLIDEAKWLGYLKVILLASDQARKFRLHLILIYQSRAQLLLQFGREEGETLIDNAGWVSYSSTSIGADMRDISAAVGKVTITSRSASRGGSAQSRGLGALTATVSDQRGEQESHRGRPLIEPDEVRRLRDDEQILVLGSNDPIRCGKAIYLRRPEFRHLAKLAPFGGRKPAATPNSAA